MLKRMTVFLLSQNRSFSALAEFERDLIRDRTRAGLEAARACGRKGGRPAQLSRKEIEKMLKYYHDRKNTVNEICKIYKLIGKPHESNAHPRR